MQKKVKKNSRNLISKRTLINREVEKLFKLASIREYLLNLKTKKFRKEFLLIPSHSWSLLTKAEKLLSKSLQIKKLWKNKLRIKKPRIKNTRKVKKVFEKWIKPEIWAKMSFVARREHKKNIVLQEQKAEIIRIKKRKARKKLYSKTNRKFQKIGYVSYGKGLKIFLSKNLIVNKRKTKYFPASWSNNRFTTRKKPDRPVVFKNGSFTYRGFGRLVNKNLIYKKKSVIKKFKRREILAHLRECTKRHKSLIHFSEGRLWVIRRGYKLPWFFLQNVQKKRMLKRFQRAEKQRFLRHVLRRALPAKEDKLIRVYTTLLTQTRRTKLFLLTSKKKYQKQKSTRVSGFSLSSHKLRFKNNKFFRRGLLRDNAIKKRLYLKHLILLRYRWVYKPTLKQFKLFKKFFRRSYKRYRKIGKNALFKLKLQRHLPKLTGYSTKGLFRLWQPLRRNYNQYWGHTGVIQKFAQSLLLMPVPLLVFLKLAPSMSAANYVVNAGAFILNGRSATTFKNVIPGDIFQINVKFQKTIQLLFSYQRWSYDLLPIQLLPFLQVDYSTLMFMLLRWPYSYEVVAPSFLTEKWIRYYVRQFSPLAKKFNVVKGNWRVYKTITYKRKK